MSIKFSVIVPIYGVEAYLEDCVESVLRQSHADFELILVDDGSKDACPAICDRYAAADPRVTVIHKANGGLVSARQAGAVKAAGDYVCCLDGDDWLAPDYLEKLAAAAEADRPDILCCGLTFVFPNKTTPVPIPFRSGFYDRENLEKEIFPSLIQAVDGNYFPLTLCGKAIRRELYVPAQSELDPAILIGEDQACTIPCFCRCGSMTVLSECLYYYRQNGASVTKKSFSFEGLLTWMEHLRQEVDLSAFDFRQQFYRRVVHEFYVVAKSQFRRSEPYAAIRRDIVSYTRTPLVAEALSKAKFAGSLKMELIAFALRHRLVLLVYLSHCFIR